MLNHSKKPVIRNTQVGQSQATQQYEKLVKWSKTHYLLKNSLKIFKLN